MTIQLRRAKIALREKQLRRRQEKGFSNELSEIGDNHSRRGEDDGVRSESEQPQRIRKILKLLVF